ncbi:hypothetical protein ABIE62_002255 [Porphyrobacter sp. MBR-155]|uniref:hypothetical protein n=1 Tax=Porphyrobacter sp. MBR-155 TaxID=3156464 RepID=UPI003399374B
MKFIPLAALGLAAAALTAPAFAAEDDAATTTAAAAAFTVDMPIEALMADERAKAAVLTTLPDLDQHPAYEQFKAMSLTAVAPFSQGMITEEVLAKIAADLAAIQ